MDEPIRDPEAARRLARTIVSDIAAYNQAEVERGLAEDDLFAVLAPQIEEGRAHYESKAHPDVLPRGFYEKALVDFLVKPFGYVPSAIW
jgi:hypothetical protein